MADKAVQISKSEPNLGLGLSLEDKIALSVELCEIALRCEKCSKLFKDAIEDYSRQVGGLTIVSSQTKEVCNIDNSRS